ncbi:hypothetical protein GU926_06580 [Nibribacter ruber]|uniref:Cupin domain-containing protein n=1 Tax=Nibribacter ruber TaxID=2698458 RepID=A0A6P1NZ30_9BACT|nr:hypothetical protein [Nibribacter ruber]QHL87111.1 hypothetical protein GU926_06580 [Nibribacter ruber]
MKMSITTIVSCLAVCLSVTVAPAFAGNTPSGPTTRTTKVFQQVLATENLRILSLELAPGEQLDFHTSPEQEAYAASAGTLRITDADGAQKEVDVKAGDRLWGDLSYFQNVNTGSKTLKIMLLERAK